ncbi:hypothetical protein BIY29_05405 [Brenneria alni]|uniref:Uncharacterized protein n=1 Tax=Brenneria alni TaxID=71656 RepID=A0A421DR34_9GAMM|nr:hypothetical protein [Brenneria alni]RLM26496.1 hypothetical protein BIY29_05405 [Brenneria alni]
MNIKTLTDRVISDTNDPELINKIQDACRKKQAFCFGTEHGRIVLAPKSRDGIPYIFIWLAASTEPGSISRYLEEVKTLTRMIGGRWVEFSTARKGFIRVAQRLGWERLADEGALMKFKIPM